MSWVPNALTGLRILLIPVVLVLLSRVEAGAGTWAAPRIAAIAVFFLMAITDWFDGYLARRLDATSRSGSMADAAADRLALLLPLLYLATREDAAFSPVPLWIPLWVVVLDVATGVAWLIARWKAGVSPPKSHNRVGQVAMWILFMLVLWILAALPYSGVVLLALAGLSLATASAGIYIRRWLGR